MSEHDQTHLGIVELADVCARMRADHLALFELLGAAVTTLDPGPHQRFVAEACHRHAELAAIWERRQPTIPHVTTSVPTLAAPTLDDYADLAADLIRSAEQLGRRVDPELDPSTARAAARTVADLAALGRKAIDTTRSP